MNENSVLTFNVSLTREKVSSGELSDSINAVEIKCARNERLTPSWTGFENGATYKKFCMEVKLKNMCVGILKEFHCPTTFFLQ